jgi:hypothetical protein
MPASLMNHSSLSPITEINNETYCLNTVIRYKKDLFTLSTLSIFGLHFYNIIYHGLGNVQVLIQVLRRLGVYRKSQRTFFVSRQTIFILVIKVKILFITVDTKILINFGLNSVRITILRFITLQTFCGVEQKSFNWVLLSTLFH